MESVKRDLRKKLIILSACIREEVSNQWWFDGFYLKKPDNNEQINPKHKEGNSNDKSRNQWNNTEKQ